jgi:asparagine synthase (glutamine-hydrolysing)
MCGIAALLADSAVDPAIADRLDSCLAHRGPDSRGAWTSADGRTVLVHRRLAIIDPTPAGAQPMRSRDGRHVIAFNGEIYNFRDIRAELAATGLRFSTETDTEILLALLAQCGPAGLSRLRGMFALAWWDERDHSLLVARDRFGIKPLYIARRPGLLAVASEIQALAGAGLVARDPDPAGVVAFLRWGVVPPTLTFLAGVEALPPGGWRRWTRDGATESGSLASTTDAWTEQSAAESISDTSLVERAHAAIVDSVRAHLVADVPVGLFLSAGIDSAVIAAAARAAGATRLRTFTVAVDERRSEAAGAGVIATALGLPHDVVPADAGRFAKDWSAIVRRLDQPSLDGVNTWLVAEAVAGTGIKAVLSGLGGDELFGGYPSFRRLPRFIGAGLPARAVLAAGGALAGTVPHRLLGPKWRHAAVNGSNATELYRAARGLFMPPELAALAGPRLRDDPTAAARVDACERAWLGETSHEQPAATVARLETRGYMTAQLLRDTDAVSMAHGLEVRVPYVDATLLATIWPELGRHPALLANKELLRQVGRRLGLPALASTRRKQPFALPFAQWMRGPLNAATRVSAMELVRAGWLTEAGVDGVWEQFEHGRSHWSRPWALAVLGQFVANR